MSAFIEKKDAVKRGDHDELSQFSIKDFYLDKAQQYF